MAGQRPEWTSLLFRRRHDDISLMSCRPMIRRWLSLVPHRSRRPAL